MKTKRKILSLLLTCAMIITVFSGMTFAADTADIDGARQAITNGMLDWQTSIDISSYNITASDFSSYIWPDVVTRDPRLFYVFNVTYYESLATGKLTTINTTYNSQYTRDSVREYEAAVNKAYNEVIRTDMTDAQKALALHDYLVQHMEYDSAGLNAGTEKRNAYEALVNGIGVCEGYTLAYAALLEKAGIEVGYCESRGLNHIWNYVKINGNWYNVDVTWDDTGTGRPGRVNHKHFLGSNAKFAADNQHTSWDSNLACTDTSFDNMYWQSNEISAVYPINNKEYFVRVLKNDQNPTLYLGGIDLVERTGAAERVVKHYDTVWYINGTFFSTPLISLSYYGGSLYFHTADKVYSFNPDIDSEPQLVYTYEGGDGVIGDSFVCNSQINLVIDQPGYTTKSVTVPITVQTDKAEQTLEFAESAIVKYKGDIPFTNVLAHTTGNGAVTYTSSNQTVATVAADGQVTVIGAGTATITANAAQTGDFLAASASYTITVKDNPAEVLPQTSLTGRRLVAKDALQQQVTSLETAANGTFMTQFSGKTLNVIDIQLIDISNGQQLHNEAVTFTISYPAGITSGNYTNYDFAVLHQKEDMTYELIDAQPTPDGLKITSTLSPFAIGYSLKQSASEPATQEPGTTEPGTTEPGTQPGTTEQGTAGTSGDVNNEPGGSDNSDNNSSDDQQNDSDTGSDSQAAGGQTGVGTAGTGNLPTVSSGGNVQKADGNNDVKQEASAAVSPQTGDTGNHAGRFVIVILACIGLSGIAVCGRKSKYNR